jgi:cytochrome c
VALRGAREGGLKRSGPVATGAAQGGAMVDSFEFSKIAGAVLAALLVIFAPKTIIDLWQQGHHVKEAGFTLPAATEQAAAPAAGGEAAAGGGVAAFDAAAVVALIGSAKAENGQATFKKCLTCHSADKAAASKAGPNLWNVVGRKKGTREDFGGYSEAMKTKGGDWTLADLAGFVHNPKGWLPGTKMVFQGVPDPQDVADLLAYVRTLADSPAALPN